MEKTQTPYDRLQAVIDTRYPNRYRLVPEATVNGWVKMELHKDPVAIKGGRPDNFYNKYKAFKIDTHDDFFKTGLISTYYDFKYDDQHVLSKKDTMYHDIHCRFYDMYHISVIYGLLREGEPFSGAHNFNLDYVFVEEILPQGGKSRRRRRKRRVSRKNRRSRK